MTPTAPTAEESRPTAEVKSLTFVTLREFLPKHFGNEQLVLLRSQLSLATLELLDSAESGAWVPEARMHELMRALHTSVLGGDDEAFLEFARGLAAAGINRFMRIFLSLTSARFVLRKVPVVWGRLRRGAGEVTVESEDSRVVLSYRGFPFFGTRAYRLLSLANCQALVLTATGSLPRGEVLRWSPDSLVLSFDLAA